MENVINKPKDFSSVAPTRPSRSRDFVELTGRISLALIFLIPGVEKIGDYAMTQGYMVGAGVPGILLPLVIGTEVLGSIAIIIGFKTRLVAFALGGFTLLAGLIFNHNLADQDQAVHLLKNISMVGGFLILMSNGAGALSLDCRIERRKALDSD